MVTDLLDEIESETLYLALVTVDRRTLQIVLLKMQGYSTKEIAPIVHLTVEAVYARLAHLRKKLRSVRSQRTERSGRKSGSGRNKCVSDRAGMALQ